MNSWIILISFAAGLASGFLFYGGLWMTVKKGMSMKQPQLLFAFSFLLRSAIVVITFYFAGGAQWQQIVICMAGLLIARAIVTYVTKEKQQALTTLTKQ